MITQISYVYLIMYPYIVYCLNFINCLYIIKILKDVVTFIFLKIGCTTITTIRQKIKKNR